VQPIYINKSAPHSILESTILVKSTKRAITNQIPK